ncbi:MAG: hypothetical protein AAB074_12340 [Planctomycetota bacterium]
MIPNSMPRDYNSLLKWALEELSKSETPLALENDLRRSGIPAQEVTRIIREACRRRKPRAFSSAVPTARIAGGLILAVAILSAPASTPPVEILAGCAIVMVGFGFSFFTFTRNREES